MLPTTFRSIRVEDFLEIDQSETRMVAMFVNGSGQNEQSL